MRWHTISYERSVVQDHLETHSKLMVLGWYHIVIDLCGDNGTGVSSKGGSRLSGRARQASLGPIASVSSAASTPSLACTRVVDR